MTLEIPFDDLHRALAHYMELLPQPQGLVDRLKSNALHKMADGLRLEGVAPNQLHVGDGCIHVVVTIERVEEERILFATSGLVEYLLRLFGDKLPDCLSLDADNHLTLHLTRIPQLQPVLQWLTPRSLSFTTQSLLLEAEVAAQGRR